MTTNSNNMNSPGHPAVSSAHDSRAAPRTLVLELQGHDVAVKHPYNEDALLDQDDESILLRLENFVFDAEDLHSTTELSHVGPRKVFRVTL